MKTQLRNWSFTMRAEDEYQPPEASVPVLQGNVYGHSNPDKHHDGKFIVTSKIVGKRNGLVVTQSGSEYDLVEIDPIYEKMYPNAKERLFAQLNDV